MLKIGGFPLKLPKNCMILKKSLGGRGPAPRPPGSGSGTAVSPSLASLQDLLQEVQVPSVVVCQLWMERRRHDVLLLDSYHSAR